MIERLVYLSIPCNASVPCQSNDDVNAQVELHLTSSKTIFDKIRSCVSVQTGKRTDVVGRNDDR